MEGFPEDDRLEYDLDAAYRKHEKLLGQVNAESRAAELLARACLVMDSCQKCMQEALGYSRYGAYIYEFFYFACIADKVYVDMWGGGSYVFCTCPNVVCLTYCCDRLTDMMERNALANAQTHASQVEVLVDQAMRLSPAVKPVGRVNIARGYVSHAHTIDPIR